MNDFITETNELKNKLNNIIKNLKTEQPYIKHNNLMLYFKVFSPCIEVIQNNVSCFKFIYYSHEIEKINYDEYKKIDNIHERINSLCDGIYKYISDVEKTQIIKEITLSFSCEDNKNLLDDKLFNNLIDNYIKNKLNSKYKIYNIISENQETNVNCKLYELYIKKEKKNFYEYFLITNSICINVTLNTFCNSTMNSIIKKMLLSCSSSKEIEKENFYLNISKEELDLAFEINSNNSSIEDNNLLSDNNKKELKKLNNLLSNYDLLKNDSSFNKDIAFNILLLGNDTNEKNYLLHSIKNNFKESIGKKEKLNLFEFDIKNSFEFYDNSEKKLKEKLKQYNFLIINNFDSLEEYDIQIKASIINTIINLKNYFGIILCGDSTKILNLINKSKELSNKFSFIFNCKDYSIDTIYDILISKLNITNYKVSLNQTEAKKTIKLLVEKSKLKNEKFINNLYTKMLKYVIENELTEFNIQSFPCINKNDIINSSINDLNNLVGLEGVKKQVKKLIAFWKFKDETSNISSINNQYFNIFLTGNPGTGKTTVAKLIEKVLYSLNYINEDKFIEVTPNDLVADYEGQTKTKTREILNQAKDGILFIDEAYLFLNDSQFYKEALIELLKYMEHPKNIVIFAGYSNLMNDLLSLNSGLKSRITTFINFDDYSKDELIKILNDKMKKQNIIIDKEALNKIELLLDQIMKEKNFGNARYIDKLTTNILIKHAENVYQNNSKELLTISKEDIDEKDILNDKVKTNFNFGFIQKNGDE